MRELILSALDEAEDKGWQERANCLGVDPDLFFPERGASTKEAKGVCGGCEVRMEGLEYALRHGEKFGIWGGMSERERRRIRRQRELPRRGLASAWRRRSDGRRQRIARPPSRSLADASLDRRVGVDPAPREEVVRAP